MSTIIVKKENGGVLLSGLFTQEANPQMCSNYGNGAHCTEEKIEKKTNLWGRRGDEAEEGSCAIARLISNNREEPGVLLNIGYTGYNPTVKISHPGVELYELGIAIPDFYLNSGDLLKGVGEQVNSIFSNCSGGKGAFIYFYDNSSDGYDINRNLAREAGMEDIDFEANSLGLSFHPERFRFENGEFQECKAWDASQGKVIHEGWYDANPCAAWESKGALLFFNDSEQE